MSNLGSATAVVVGIDGSKSAIQAALWAIDEAVSRDIPLRLVSVVEGVACERRVDEGRTFARMALFDAHRAVEACDTPVKIETEVLAGTPLNTLKRESRSAAMICVGAMGLNHARFGQGSVAGALAGSALCPVAVVHRRAGLSGNPQISRVVAEVDNGAVLRHAFEEARMRSVPLRVVAVCASGATQLDRRLARWARLYPDVTVEQEVVRGHACRYMADGATPDQLFVTDSYAAQVCSVYNAGSSVLTVRSGNL